MEERKITALKTDGQKAILEMLVPDDIVQIINELISNGFSIVSGRSVIKKITNRLSPVRDKIVIARDDKLGGTVIALRERPIYTWKKNDVFGSWVYRLVFGDKNSKN